MKVAPNPPVYCAACFGQYPDRLHVDFEASYDGPVIDSSSGIKVSIDDLIICEKCIRTAASFFKLVDADDLRAENAELGDLIEFLRQQIITRDDTIADLTDVVKRLKDEMVKRSDFRKRRYSADDAVAKAEELLGERSKPVESNFSIVRA